MLPNYIPDLNGIVQVRLFVHRNGRCLRGGSHFFFGRQWNFCFWHIRKELFETFKLVFVWTPYLHFSLRYGGPNLGPKNPQIFNFIRNKKIWCQIVDIEAHFTKPFEFLKSDKNWLRHSPPKGARRPPKSRFHSLWGFCSTVTWSFFNLNIFMLLFDREHT